MLYRLMEKSSIFIMPKLVALIRMGFRDHLAKANWEINMLLRTKFIRGSQKQGQYDFRLAGESNPWKCKSCSRKVSSLAVYCHHCGQKIR